jgi:membrane-associated phospholipid phosphatase
MAERLKSLIAGRRTAYRIPLFLTPDNKYPIAIAASVLFSVMYLTSNHVHLFEPQYLPMSRLDHAIPFIPQTIWIYTSDLVLFFAAYILCTRIETANKYLWAFFALQTVSVAIFWLWPTTYPREFFPLPADLDAASHYIFSHLRLTDSPANCLPSLHVSSCYLAAYAQKGESPKRFWIFFVWATLVSISTLTTKQHYIADVIFGFIFGYGAYWVFFTKADYRWVAGAQANR